MIKAIAKFIYENPFKIGAIAGLIFIFNLISSCSSFTPDTTREFASTSVKVVNFRGGGGSGSIIKSSVTESIILTNKHVCEVVEKGGEVIRNTRSYIISEIKKYELHDLCLVKVNHNFIINTKIANNRPTTFSKAVISGHPALMPHILSHGDFSRMEIIALVTGSKKCDKDDKSFYCQLFGKKPIFEFFQAQVVSSLIRGGSSGSAVFNEDGEIAGVAFAGISGGLSHAYIVPFSYVKDFLDNQDKYEWIKAGSKVKKDNKERKFEQKVCKYSKKCTLLWGI